MYDDVEGETGQNRLMVGSMNGASKFTKGEGEEQQLGGTIFTKNLKVGMKMPAKIREGRNNWLLMEKDPAYEEEDMTVNCAENFDHCNEMNTNYMPRDFLAALTRYFLRMEFESTSFFQDAQLEACQVIASRRPHWRKRKSKSAAIFLSMFFLVEKEALESNDPTILDLFREVFHDRDSYIETLMKMFDRIDEIELLMIDGIPMELPPWADDILPTNGDNEEISSTVETNCVDDIVIDSLNVVTAMNDTDKSKYVKIFKSKEDSEVRLGKQSI